MDDFELELKTEFINEALMNLEDAESSFMELEGAAEPKELLDKIFRLAHNLKGGSRAVGLPDVAEFTHQLENLVLKIQQKVVELNPRVITVLLHANDRLVEMLTVSKGNLNATFDNADVLREIQDCLNPDSAPASEPAPVAVAAEITPSAEIAVVAETASVEEPVPPSASDFFEANPAETSGETLPSLTVAAPAERAAEAKAPAKAGKDDEIVRVSLARIESLNNFVGELIVAQSVVTQLAQSRQFAGLNAAVQQMTKIAKEIQSLSMSLRMLPVKPLVQKLQRAVRDTAQTLGKDIQFEIRGDQLDVDKSVLDALGDPLIHILRNAVDHGLESTVDRQGAGKSPRGRVELSFENEGNFLIVEVKDDGKGIDARVIRQKAIEKRLIREDQALTEKQLIHLIFHPGFSTKAVTSEISGRGVGMDVVKTNVEKIGGSVDIATEVGRGSRFRVKIPLSLAVIDGWVVKTNAGRYVVPVSQITETVSLKGRKLHSGYAGMTTVFDLRGTVVPLIPLDGAVKAVGGASAGVIDPHDIALIVNVDEQLIGITVREIVCAQQIVVKPLGLGVTAQKGWIGSCVLGDGLPTLILSPSEILAGSIVKGRSHAPTKEAA